MAFFLKLKPNYLSKMHGYPQQQQQQQQVYFFVPHVNRDTQNK